MAVSRLAAGLARVSRGLPVPVFAAVGADLWPQVQELRAQRSLRLVTSPRHAAVLLVAGTVPDAHLEALWRVHDQRPAPRTTVAWRPGGVAGQVPAAVTVRDGEVVAALRGAFADVLAAPERSDADLLPDTDPNEWRGVGPFGQGGEGMMGGTPYGRAMAMTDDDLRDGLALDHLQVTLGPFLDAFPGGLEVDVGLQGDVVQQATARLDACVQAPATRSDDDALGAARHGLCWLAHALHVEGVDALAVRAAALAARVQGDVDRAALARDTGALLRRVTRSGVLWSLRGVGVVDGRDGGGGSVARQLAGDAADRWRRHTAAITAALRDGTVPVPAPPAGTLRDLLERTLPGLTVSDAVSTIVSFDLGASRVREEVAA